MLALDDVNVALSGSGDEAAVNEVWHVAVYAPEPLSASVSVMQPEIGTPPLKKSTVPAGAGEFGVTVAVRVTV